MKDRFKYVVLTRPLASEQRVFMHCGCTPCGEELTSGCSSTSAGCAGDSWRYQDAACCGYSFEAQGVYLAALEDRLASIEHIFEHTEMGRELKLECDEERCRVALEKADQELQEVQQKRTALKPKQKKK